MRNLHVAPSEEQTTIIASMTDELLHQRMNYYIMYIGLHREGHLNVEVDMVDDDGTLYQNLTIRPTLFYMRDEVAYLSDGAVTITLTSLISLYKKV